MTQVTEQRVTAVLAPRREGANIRTWIGFKHFLYLAEEAVLAWFRDRGTGPAALFGGAGLELSIVDSSALLPAVLELDDVVDAEVAGGPSRFTVRLSARRDGAPTVLRGKVTVALLAADGIPTGPVPPDLVPAVAGSIAAAARAAAGAVGLPGLPGVPGVAGVAGLAGVAGVPGMAGVDGLAGVDGAEDGDAGEPAVPGVDPSVLLATHPGGFLWSWRVPYYYCQFSRRIQHSGYVRALEEVVDRFLADRGLSVRTLLDARGWIPVVSRARVTQLSDVEMEETVHTVFTVTDVLKDVSFDARMDCYVERGGALVPAATGRILHAYAIARGPGAGRLAQLDPPVVAALTGRSRR